MSKCLHVWGSISQSPVTSAWNFLSQFLFLFFFCFFPPASLLFLPSTREAEAAGPRGKDNRSRRNERLPVLDIEALPGVTYCKHVTRLPSQTQALLWDYTGYTVTKCCCQAAWQISTWYGDLNANSAISELGDMGIKAWFKSDRWIHGHDTSKAGQRFTKSHDSKFNFSSRVIRWRKYSPSRWLQQMVTMVATDVPGGMTTEVARQFWRPCPADNSRNMF